MFSCIWVLSYRSFGLDLESAQLARQCFGEDQVFPPRNCKRGLDLVLVSEFAKLVGDQALPCKFDYCS